MGTCNVGPQTQANIQQGIDRFTRRQRLLTTVKQLGYEFSAFAPLQTFVNLLGKMQNTSSLIKVEGEKILQNWAKLGPDKAEQVELALAEVSVESHEKGRRLTQAEEQAILTSHGFTPEMAQIYADVNTFLGERLEQVRLMLLAEAGNKLGLNSLEYLAEEGRINTEFAAIKDRNYFPMSRFGKHTVLVHATGPFTYQGRNYRPGQLVIMENYDTEREQKARYNELHPMFFGQAAHVSQDVLPDSLQQLYGMPPNLVQRMIDQLQLSPNQIDLARQFAYSLTPNRSYLKHLLARRGVKGFSLDGQRVFASYTQSVANHIARMENRHGLQQAIQDANVAATGMRASGSAVATRQLAQWMKELYDYVMNPPNEYSSLRGLLFLYHFAYVPKQVAVNLLQTPAFTLPYLASAKELTGTGLTEASVAISKSIKDISALYFNRGSLSPTEQQAFDNALADGTFGQSFATELAALAHGSPLRSLFGSRLYAGVPKNWARKADAFFRQGADWGVAGFRVSEEFNRRVAFLAAFRMAEKRGMAPDEAAKFASSAVDKTQFDYSQYNRIPVARGKGPEGEHVVIKALRPIAPVLLVYKTYLQHALWAYGKGDGRAKALLIHLLLAGLMGMPGAEDLINLVELLGTKFKWLFGIKNPRVELNKDLRELFNTVGLGDYAMHGLSRHLFGLFDVQQSLSMGSVVPGVDPAVKGLLKEIGATEASLRVLQELSGAVGAAGINLAKALFAFDGSSASFAKNTLPTALRNAAATWTAYREESFTTANGQKLVPMNLADPHSQAELLGTLIGFRPTRVSEEQERRFLAAEIGVYYRVRKELALNTWGLAVISKDPATRKEALASVREHNKVVPPEFRITYDALEATAISRTTNRTLQEMGLPSQAEYLRLYQEYREVFRSR